MKHFVYLNVMVSLALSSCAFNDSVCEDITLASEQVQACDVLQKQIRNTKDKPLIRTELERRYQKNCIDIRYYRDDQEAAKCGVAEKKNNRQ